MAPCSRGVGAALVLALLVIGPFTDRADAAKGVRWAPKRFPVGCEPPSLFYSSNHGSGALPCCPTIEGVCAGGAACPANGICADGKSCQQGAVADRPNIVLFVSDDQNYCAYGHAEECRSPFSGTAVPAPNTPNLDLLAGHGTVFPIAHNTSPWCFPSLASILTGRFQKDMHGSNKILESAFLTIPSAVRGLVGDPSAQSDPYNPGNVVGGYCTLLGGKFAGALDQNAFDAVTRTTRKLGRNDCTPGSPPTCGASVGAPYTPLAPTAVNRMVDAFGFLDSLIYRLPVGNPAQYAMQHFFVWYAPRMPHEPLRAPQPVSDYLFGSSAVFPRGGLMDLGRWCAGSSCAPVVTAFNEGVFGTLGNYYNSVWWVDDNVRQLRRFLAEESTPHCIDADGHSRFDATPAQCPGTWTAVAPDLPRETIIIYVSDNGWQLPNSKHVLTENGYRTRLVVFDPRGLPAVPSWDATQEATPPAQTVEAVAHSTDLLPTILGFALGTAGRQACPLGPDGFACDGRDLRPQLVTAPGGPSAPENLRHSLCGHLTQRVTSPGHNRYLLTRPGSLGRCTKATNPVCVADAQCQPGEFCVGGHCAPAVSELGCSDQSQCPAGAACLGAKCRMAPTCLDDGDCTALVGATGYVCAGRDQRWCRNAPNAACATNDDCPVCPSVNGNPVPCSRLCEARTLKLYVSPGPESPQSHFLTDLFIDPDERGLYSGDPHDPTLLVTSLSNLSGPYAGAIRRMNCCIDQWWPEEAQASGTLCSAGYSCPADLVCNQ